MARRALVTGGNRGIGFAIAEGLRDAGLSVIIAARDQGAAREAAGKLGVDHVLLDLEDAASIATALEQAGEVDVLINNAGILEDVSILEPGDNLRLSLAVMVEGPQALMAALVPGMGARGWGRVVNVSSGWGSFAEGLGGGGGYAVAKAALNALTVRAAQEAPTGVKINAMCPGWVRTRMGGSAAPRSPEDGADTAIWLSTLDPDGPTGGFFRDRKVIPW